jgi:hypothetical protein
MELTTEQHLKAEIQRLRHMIYDAHKFIDRRQGHYASETAAAILRREADQYDYEQRNGIKRWN